MFAQPVDGINLMHSYIWLYMIVYTYIEAIVSYTQPPIMYTIYNCNDLHTSSKKMPVPTTLTKFSTHSRCPRNCWHESSPRVSSTTARTSASPADRAEGADRDSAEDVRGFVWLAESIARLRGKSCGFLDYLFSRGFRSPSSTDFAVEWFWILIFGLRYRNMCIVFCAARSHPHGWTFISPWPIEFI